MVKAGNQSSENRIYGGRRPRVVRPGVEQYDTATQTLKKGRGKDYGSVEEDSAIDHGNLSGLGDNDHPQYFLKNAADGDNIVLGSSTGTKIGTATTQKLGFYNATPIVRPSAYTQTYSTADKTHAAFTSADLTGITTSTTGSTLAEPSAAYTQSEMQQNFRRIQDQYNLLRADVADLKQLVNSIIDDLQSLGLVG